MRTSRKDSDLAFPKRHQPSRRERWRRHYRKWRPIVREEVYTRDGGRCRCPCQRLLELNSDNPWEHANINENPPRSKGGDPTDRRQCLTFQKECHALFTAGRLTYTATDPALGTDGPVIFEGDLAVSPGHIRGYVSHPVIRHYEGESDGHAFEG